MLTVSRNRESESRLGNELRQFVSDLFSVFRLQHKEPQGDAPVTKSETPKKSVLRSSCKRCGGYGNRHKKFCSLKPSNIEKKEGGNPSPVDDGVKPTYDRQERKNSGGFH